MNNIDTLIGDIYSTLETKNYTGNLELIALDLGKEVEEALKEHFRPKEDKRKLRLSQIGKCTRSQWYDYHNYEKEKMKPQVWITFLQGHILEALLKALIKLSGHTLEDEQKNHWVESVRGSQDATVDGELVDVKTASQFSFLKFKKDGLKEDPFGYVQQLSAYGLKEGKDYGYFLALNKNNGELKLTKQTLNKNVAEDVKDLKFAIEGGLPERCKGAVKETKIGQRLNTTCAYCGHRDTCFPDLVKVKSGKIDNYYIKLEMPGDEEDGSF